MALSELYSGPVGPSSSLPLPQGAMLQGIGGGPTRIDTPKVLALIGVACAQDAGGSGILGEESRSAIEQHLAPPISAGRGD